MTISSAFFSDENPAIDLANLRDVTTAFLIIPEPFQLY
jgi:hypothetical protein